MGIDSKALPNDFLRCMNPESRKSLGKAGRTQEEIDLKNRVRLEKELKQQCLNLLSQRNIFCISARNDRKTTIPVGTPDLNFVIPQGANKPGLPCAVELKMPGEQPDPDQVRVLQQMADNGWTIRVITSVEHFQIFLNNHGSKPI